jgi:hypothetical protein
VHPFYVASQFHPEFKSRPDRPAPLFREFVGAAYTHSGGTPTPCPDEDRDELTPEISAEHLSDGSLTGR